MAITYQSIFDMPSAGDLKHDDRLLIARGNSTYYSTYKTTLDMLSATAYDAFVGSAFQLSVISNEDELVESQTNKAVGGNLGYAFKTRINTLSSNAVVITGDQNISGVKTFTSTPNIPNASRSNDRQAVNYGTLTSYVQSSLSVQTPLFSTLFHGAIYNLTSFVSRLCPLWKSSAFPTTFTIFASFYQSANTKKTPKFEVYDTSSGSDVNIATTLYAGTADINSNTSETIKSYAKYKCVVNGIKGNKIKIVLDNKNASIQVSLSIYPGNITVDLE